MLKILLLAALLPLPSLAAASSELTGSSNAYVTVRTDTSPDNGSSNSSTLISMEIVYGFFLSPYWELEAGLYGYDLTGAGGNYQITPRAGIAYNFSDETQNSFYLGGRAGPSFVTVSSSHDYVLFDYVAFLGKRFSLVEHVSWAPEISFNGHSSGSTIVNGARWTFSSRTAWTFTPLQVAVLF